MIAATDAALTRLSTRHYQAYHQESSEASTVEFGLCSGRRIALTTVYLPSFCSSLGSCSGQGCFSFLHLRIRLIEVHVLDCWCREKARGHRPVLGSSEFSALFPLFVNGNCSARRPNGPRGCGVQGKLLFGR